MQQNKQRITHAKQERCDVKRGSFARSFLRVIPHWVIPASTAPQMITSASKNLSKLIQKRICSSDAPTHTHTHTPSGFSRRSVFPQSTLHTDSRATHFVLIDPTIERKSSLLCQDCALVLLCSVIGDSSKLVRAAAKASIHMQPFKNVFTTTS